MEEGSKAWSLSPPLSLDVLIWNTVTRAVATT